MTKNTQKRLLGSLFGFALLFGAGFFTQDSYSLALTNVSDTLSNSRLSFRGALGAGNTVGSSIVILDTTPNTDVTPTYPSTSSAQLVEGDVLSIGEDASLGNYTVASTSSQSTFYIKSPDNAELLAGDADVGDDVISTQSATHTIRFTTANAIPNGSFRVLVPALADDGAAADGIPDGGYFDYGSTAPTVTCPGDTGNYTFGAATAAESSVTIGSQDYHAFTCPYTGNGGSGTNFNGTPGSANGGISIAGLINPAPKENHVDGVADTYSVIVQNLDSGSNVIDTTTVRVGVIEAVKVTVSVPAQLTFKIIGVDSGQPACGNTTDVSTSATDVPFGEIPLDDFTDAAQTLSVSTNAAQGYSVTAIENDQLGLSGAACPGDPTTSTNCIIDSRGDTALMTHTTFDSWTDSLTKGFGYSLDDSNNSTTEAFSYNIGTGACSGSAFCAKQFADAEQTGTTQPPQEIFSSNTVAENENLKVCYRVIPAVTTAAGNYENYITYTATATF